MADAELAETYGASASLFGLEMSIGAVGLVGNLLVILTIWRSPSLHGLTNYLLLNLAVADGLVCGTGLFNSLVYPDQDPCEREVHQLHVLAVYGYLSRGIAGQSVLSLLLVTFERFVGIVHPLHHRSYFSKRRVAALLLLVWLTPLALQCAIINMYFAAWSVSTNCTAQNPSSPEMSALTGLSLLDPVLLFLLPAAAMLCMYAKILRSLREGARRLERLGAQGPPQELHRASKRVVRLLSVVTAAFLLLLSPQKLLTILYALAYDWLSIPHSVLQWALILNLLNSTVNPFLYALLYDNFRRAVKEVFCRCKRRPRLPATAQLGLAISPRINEEPCSPDAQHCQIPSID